MLYPIKFLPNTLTIKKEEPNNNHPKKKKKDFKKKNLNIRKVISFKVIVYFFSIEIIMLKKLYKKKKAKTKIHTHCCINSLCSIDEAGGLQ